MNPNRVLDMLFSRQKFEPLVDELRRCNRHFSQNSAVNTISEFVHDIKQYDTIHCTTHLYRARICNPDNCKELGLDKWGEKHGIMFRSKSYVDDEDLGDLAGLNAEASGAPPASRCGENRASGKGIRRLYVAEQPRTAIAEVRPLLRSFVSIAELEVKYNDFWVLDLTKHSHEENGCLRELIDRMFATPCFGEGDSESYSFTQWFTDLVADFGVTIPQEKGVELLEVRGIKYSSAMDYNGKNIVLFNSPKRNPYCEDKCSEEFFDVKVIKTEIYFIDNVRYDIEQPENGHDDVFNLKNGNCPTNIDIAKKLKTFGVDVKIIVDLTGISADEILRL